MTYIDLFTQILSEVTGQPKEYIRAMTIEFFGRAGANMDKLHRTIPPAEYDRLLAELRQEKEGIRAWLIKGQLRATLNLIRDPAKYGPLLAWTPPPVGRSGK